MTLDPRTIFDVLMLMPSNMNGELSLGRIAYHLGVTDDAAERIVDAMVAMKLLYMNRLTGGGASGGEPCYGITYAGMQRRKALMQKLEEVCRG